MWKNLKSSRSSKPHIVFLRNFQIHNYRFQKTDTTYKTLHGIPTFFSTISHKFPKYTTVQHITPTCSKVLCQDITEKGKLPASITKLLDQAKTSLEKLSTSAMKLLKNQDMLEPQQAKTLRSQYATCQRDLSEVNHVRLFRELPNGKPLNKQSFDAAVFEVAQHVEQLNESVEQAKAKVRARSN